MTPVVEALPVGSEPNLFVNRSGEVLPFPMAMEANLVAGGVEETVGCSDGGDVLRVSRRLGEKCE